MVTVYGAPSGFRPRGLFWWIGGRPVGPVQDRRRNSPLEQPEWTLSRSFNVRC